MSTTALLWWFVPIVLSALFAMGEDSYGQFGQRVSEGVR